MWSRRRGQARDCLKARAGQQLREAGSSRRSAAGEAQKRVSQLEVSLVRSRTCLLQTIDSAMAGGRELLNSPSEELCGLFLPYDDCLSRD
jgi:hypothetical protein